jgi:nucleotide-binding universal stress UspA family protein
MQAIKKILFPTDFSPTAQNAFRYCLWLADQWEARIELLHVVFPEYDALDLPVMATKATQEKVEAARLVLQTFVDQTLLQVQAGYEFRHAPDVRSDVEVGGPAIISQIARRDEADLIVMGAKGEHNVMERLFGSVTTGVIDNAHCNVLVIPEHAGFGFLNVAVYASDLNEADPYHLWKVGQWLEPLGAVLHCVHVRTATSDERELKISDMEAFFQDHAPALQIRFHQFAGDSVTEALDEFADLHNADLLIMYAPHHNLLERIFRPSRTKKMALQTEVPLLLLKPS